MAIIEINWWLPNNEFGSDIRRVGFSFAIGINYKQHWKTKKCEVFQSCQYHMKYLLPHWHVQPKFHLISVCWLSCLYIHFFFNHLVQGFLLGGEGGGDRGPLSLHAKIWKIPLSVGCPPCPEPKKWFPSFSYPLVYTLIMNHILEEKITLTDKYYPKFVVHITILLFYKTQYVIYGLWE